MSIFLKKAFAVISGFNSKINMVTRGKYAEAVISLISPYMLGTMRMGSSLSFRVLHLPEQLKL